jgi:hypothetical protein
VITTIVKAAESRHADLLLVGATGCGQGSGASTRPLISSTRAVFDTESLRGLAHPNTPKKCSIIELKSGRA